MLDFFFINIVLCSIKSSLIFMTWLNEYNYRIPLHVDNLDHIKLYPVNWVYNSNTNYIDSNKTI